MKVGFAGLSHLGIVTSIAVCSHEIDVIAFDPNAALCDALSHGKLPLYELGLEELLKTVKTNIRFTCQTAELGECDLVYISKDVPTDQNNRSELEPVESLIGQVVPFMKAGATLVILCQVPPGFMRALKKKVDALAEGKDLKLFYQVETLIFGNAVDRALYPERFIIGCEDPEKPLPRKFEELLKRFRCPIFVMRYESAELAKISINLCLVASINTANTLAELCEAIGADWKEIVPTLKTDKRIGPHAYLDPGLGLSGGNLERDLMTVRSLAAEHGTDAGIIDAWLLNSRRREQWAYRILCHELLSKVDDPAIAIWGLAYKPNTASTKNSPSLSLIKALSGSAKIRLYDPQARLDNKYEHVLVADSALAACKDVHALVIMTPWAEFSTVAAQNNIWGELKAKLIIDPFGLLNHKSLISLNLKYFRLGSREGLL